MSSVAVPITKLPHAENLELPAYATEHAAGMDLCAAVPKDVVLLPGERALIPTGLTIALPEGYEAQVRPRSGLALKNGVTVLNSPGTIDADYRGEVGVIASVTEPFCDHCNRVRITADGQLRTCLFSIEETDLRTPMRRGASDEERFLSRYPGDPRSAEVRFFLAVDYYRLARASPSPSRARYRQLGRAALEAVRAARPGSMEARTAEALLEDLARRWRALPR